MSLLRLYGRVLESLGSEARLGWLLALANVLLAVAQFAEPVLFGWIIDQAHPGWVSGLLDIFTVIGLITVLFPGGSLTV